MEQGYFITEQDISQWLYFEKGLQAIRKAVN